MNDDASLIAKLGGVAFVADGIGAPYTTVDSWKRARRIPAWRRPAVADFAKRLGIALPPGFVTNAAPEQNTSVPRHGGVASAVKAASGGREGPAPEGVTLSGEGDARDSVKAAPIPAADRWAGRTVQCSLCERRLSESTVRACQAPDCPHSDREAA